MLIQATRVQQMLYCIMEWQVEMQIICCTQIFLFDQVKSETISGPEVFNLLLYKLRLRLHCKMWLPFSDMKVIQNDDNQNENIILMRFLFLNVFTVYKTLVCSVSQAKPLHLSIKGTTEQNRIFHFSSRKQSDFGFGRIGPRPLPHQIRKLCGLRVLVKRCLADVCSHQILNFKF